MSLTRESSFYHNHPKCEKTDALLSEAGAIPFGNKETSLAGYSIEVILEPAKHVNTVKRHRYFCLYSSMPKWLPSGSNAKAHQPNPGISIFGTTILPPNASTFLL